MRTTYRMVDIFFFPRKGYEIKYMEAVEIIHELIFIFPQNVIDRNLSISDLLRCGTKAWLNRKKQHSVEQPIGVKK